MNTPGNIKLEIFDLENTSGTPYIAWAICEGTVDSYNQVDFSLRFDNLQTRHSVPVVIRGMGPSTRFNNSVEDPFLQFSINNGISVNADWTGSLNSGVMYSGGLAPTGLKEAADLKHPFFGNHSVIFRSGNNQAVSLLDGKRGRIDLIRPTTSGMFESSVEYSGNGFAWLTYNLTGLNNAIFALSIEIVDLISGNTGTNIIVDHKKASELLFYSGVKMSGRCDEVNLAAITSGMFCAAQTGNDAPITVCLPTGLSSGIISQTIQQTSSRLHNNLSQQGVRSPSLLTDSEMAMSSTELDYAFYSGQIAFNDPVSGDYICFRAYNFDYTGTYSGKFNAAPPFSEIRECWYFGSSYSSIESLANAINNSLDEPNSFYLWNRDMDCAYDNRSGYYETGFLLRASVINDNLISIVSHRLGRMGAFEFSFYSAARSGETQVNQNSYKYLWPKTVQLLGSNDKNNWTTILNNNSITWEKARKSTRIGEYNSLVEGFSQDNEQVPEIGATGGSKTQLLYSATITGKNKCGTAFSQEISFVQPSSGFGCDIPSDWSDDAQAGVSPEGSGNLITYNLLKTGWKSNSNTGYNYYQVRISDFYNHDLGQRLSPRNEFYISNITFYKVETGNILHTGEACLYGSYFTGQIMGLATGILTGTLSGNANASGFLCFDYQQITGTPQSIKIGTAAGYPSSPFTGVFNGCFGGTGLYVENIIGYYWNGAGCVEFSKPVTGTISGNGLLSGGPYLIIKDESIYKLTGVSYVSSSGVTIHSGIIPNFSSLFSDIAAFYNYTGSLTGDVLSGGCLTFNQTITRSVPFAYSPIVSGNVSALNILEYGSPQSGDRIFINDIPIIYSNQSGFVGPTYFDNRNALVSIINSGSGQFGVTGDLLGADKIIIKSTALGVSGNGIACYASGSPTFVQTGTVSGLNIYFPLSPINLFTGNISQSLCATGFFTAEATGSITGSVKQLDFIRYFTGVWSLSTGDMDFGDSNLVSGNRSLQNYGLQTLHNYSGNPYFLPVGVGYTNNPVVSTIDLVKLIISGYGIGSGIEMILSGQL